MGALTAKQAQRLLEPWSPSAREPWDRRRAAHLLRRAAFGGSPAAIDDCVRRGLGGSLRKLFDVRKPDGRFERILRLVGGELVDLAVPGDLRAWWIFRMLHTEHPLVEKMTLFWHGHFATSVAKVRKTDLLFAQNETLRRHALGKLRPFLYEVSRDPAMLIWLDNRLNRKGRPNENYARELLELFTMGIGNYTENDVRGAARAFTGWHLRKGRFFFNRRAHDSGVKDFLGSRGHFDGEDVIDIILEQRATAAFLARKLLTFFVHPQPEPALVEALAGVLRGSGYDIGTTLRTLLSSKVFFSPRAYRALIKSPVELVVGAVQALEGRVSARLLAAQAAAMGQDLFRPPSVKGWDGGRDWINPSRLLARWNFAMRLTAARGGRFGSHLRPGAIARRYGHRSARDVVDYYLATLLQDDVPAAVRTQLRDYLAIWDGGRRRPFRLDRRTVDSKVRGLCHLVLTLPEYQVS